MTFMTFCKKHEIQLKTVTNRRKLAYPIKILPSISSRFLDIFYHGVLHENDSSTIFELSNYNCPFNFCNKADSAAAILENIQSLSLWHCEGYYLCCEISWFCYCHVIFTTCSWMMDDRWECLKLPHVEHWQISWSFTKVQSRRLKNPKKTRFVNVIVCLTLLFP